MKCWKGVGLREMSIAAAEDRRRADPKELAAPTRGELRILAMLAERPLLAADLAGLLNVTISTVKKRLYDLRIRGLLVRPQSPDYRKDAIRLTAEGLELAGNHRQLLNTTG